MALIMRLANGSRRVAQNERMETEIQEPEGWTDEEFRADFARGRKKFAEAAERAVAEDDAGLTLPCGTESD